MFQSTYFFVPGAYVFMEINVATSEQSFSYLFIHSNSISSLYKNYVSRGRPTLQMTTSNSTTFHDGLSTCVT